ncbi:MAG: carboxypeptidase regulatory-like domain-containing protein [Phycisphaerae bacterium]|nr:carboxypeptidase regulatory-like domain-containing protein [Phycisphaerae bacterium]
MNRPHTILLAVTMTALALASSAKAYTITRVQPASASVSVLEDEMTYFEAKFSGLIWPYAWHSTHWYVDDQWKATNHDVEGSQTATARDWEILQDPGTHVVKVRGWYDTAPWGVDDWTSYLSWTVTVVSRDTYAVERLFPPEQSTEIVHNAVGCGAKFSGLVSQATWQQVEWYVDGALDSAGPLSEGASGYVSYIYPTFPIGTHEVKVRAKWSLNGAEVWTDYTTWTVEIVPHPPTAGRVSPDSPVTLPAGGTQAFTARGTDVGDAEHRLEIAGVRWYVDGSMQSDMDLGAQWTSTVDNTWSHTFDASGTHQVEAVFYDYEGYSSPDGQAVWTVVVEGHDPSGTIISPDSPTTVLQNTPVTFTLEGTDPADDLDYCEVSLDGIVRTSVPFSGAASGSTAEWTHTFATLGTHRVWFVPFDAAGNSGVACTWTVQVQAESQQAGLNILVVGLDAQGQAAGVLSDATVELAGPGTATTATVDGQGRLALAGLIAGAYTVNVSRDGYYAQSRSVSLAGGETKDEVFRLTPESQDPVAFDFTSPDGKHFIEGLPGDLSFSCIVAWNGQPGSVHFNMGGTSYPAKLTDLGEGKALATLTIPAPAEVVPCSEIEAVVETLEGKTGVLRTGNFVYGLDARLRYYGYLGEEYFGWKTSGPTQLTGAMTFYDKKEVSLVLFDTTSSSSPLSMKASLGYQHQLTYDPWTGIFTRSNGGFGRFNLSLKGTSGGIPLDFLGDGRIDAVANETILLAVWGCDAPTSTSSFRVSFAGKTGIGGPVVNVVSVAFPPAATPIRILQKTPVIGKLIDSLKLRLFLILGGGIIGKSDPTKPADCWFGTSSTSATLTFGLEAQMLFAYKKWGWNLEAGVYVGGTGTPEFQFCPEPLVFQGVTLRAYVGVFASAWSFRYSGEVGMTIRFGPDKPGQVLAIASIPGSGPEGSWQPIGDSCLRWGRTNLLAAEGDSGGRLHSLSAQGESTREAILVENVVPLANPVIRSSASDRQILFCLHDPNKPWYAATDIGVLRQADEQPWTLDRIADDLAAEFSPSVVTTDSGETLATWERVSGDASDANAPDQMAPHLEIVAAWFDPNTGFWSERKQLTSNAAADHQPMAIALGATSGILWIQNEGDAAIGNANSGDRLMFVRWSGNKWEEPQVLWSAPKGISGFSYTADEFGEGNVVLAVDEDGDPNTTADCELYRLATASGAWQTAVQLTSDSAEDSLPTLVAPDGVPMCVWNADGTLLYSALYDWNPREVYREYTLANEAPSLDGVTMPGGAAIAYTVQGPNGVDIVASFYDADLDCWSLPRQLTSDEDAETSVSLAWDADELVIAYLKTQTLRTGMDVEIEGQMVHIENVPQPGRADLYVLQHALADDLAVISDSLVVEPANPAPGTTTTVRATVENRGDLPLQDVEVVFYDGDPAGGGAVIGNPQGIAGTLIAGAKQEVSVSWNVPAKESSHEIFVAVDPSLAIEDRDRSNNELSVRTVLPDLVVATCWSTEVSSTMMALTARVVNAGVIPAGGFDVSWRLGAADGQEIGFTAVGSLIVGGAYETTFLWDTTGHLSDGQHAQVFAVVDAMGDIPESDDTNNVSSLAVFHAAREP